jgi:hypothetical protein
LMVILALSAILFPNPAQQVRFVNRAG